MTATQTAARPLAAPDVSPAALAALAEAVGATAAQYDASGEFPWQGIRAARDFGVLNLGIHPDFGGAEVSLTDTARVLIALGGADASVALIAAQTIAQHIIQGQTRFWPEHLYRDALATAATRPLILNAVRAEPEWGAPARGGLPATTVTRASGGWLLNGRKAYATGSEGLDFHLVWAVEHTPDGPRVAHAVVPGDAPGIEVVKTWDHLGLRASSTHDVIYSDVQLPLENFIGQPAGPNPNESSIYAAITVSFIALYVGVARAAQRFLVQFAHDRVPSSLGKPIATTERIQAVVGEVEVQLIQAESILFGLTRRVDAGEVIGNDEGLIAKVLITRSAIAAVQTAVAAIGNPALTRANPLERHLRDVLCARVHPPQEDLALTSLGRSVLGL